MFPAQTKCCIGFEEEGISCSAKQPRMEGGCESGHRLLMASQSCCFDQFQTFFDVFTWCLGILVGRTTLR